MTNIYRIVNRYFEKGIYSAEDVARFVAAGQLTPDEYKGIVGEDYPSHQV